MTRDEIKAIIDGVTDEQINKILDIYGRDLAKQKQASKDAQAELSKVKDQLEEKDKTIKQLEAAGGDVEKMRQELESYKQAEAQRQKDEENARLDAILTQTAETALKDKQFVNDVTRAHYLGELKKAISDKANKGKTPDDLFAEMTKDAQGIFANPQDQRVTIPPVDKGGAPTMTKEQIMQIKDRGERRAAIAANMNLFEPKGDQ